MRSVELSITPRDGVLHPIDQRVASDPAVSREHVHNVNLLEDGTAIAVYRLRGDVERVRTLLEESGALDYRVTSGPGGIAAFVHFEANERVTDLLTIFDAYELGLDRPLEFTDRGGLAVQVYGTDAVIREAIDTVPDDVRVEIRRVGDYQPGVHRLYGALTERQRETLRAALEAGYYRVPRESTQADVAEELDRSAGTVGEHLRKIEAKVMAAIVP